MQKASIPFWALLISIFKDNKLNIIDNQISITLEHFNDNLTLGIQELDDDLLLTLSSETKPALAQSSPLHYRHLHDYENYLVDTMKKLADKVLAKISIRLHSIEVKIFSFRQMADIDKANLFMALKHLDIIYLGGSGRGQKY